MLHSLFTVILSQQFLRGWGGGGGKIRTTFCIVTPPGLGGWLALQIVTWEGKVQSAKVDILQLDLSGLINSKQRVYSSIIFCSGP